MPQEIVIKFIVICAICALIGGVYNGLNYYHDRKMSEEDVARGSEELRVFREHLVKKAIIFGVQSWFWIIVLILACFAASYPVFHELK